MLVEAVKFVLFLLDKMQCNCILNEPNLYLVSSGKLMNFKLSINIQFLITKSDKDLPFERR